MTVPPGHYWASIDSAGTQPSLIPRTEANWDNPMADPTPTPAPRVDAEGLASNVREEPNPSDRMRAQFAKTIRALARERDELVEALDNLLAEVEGTGGTYEFTREAARAALRLARGERGEEGRGT